MLWVSIIASLIHDGDGFLEPVLGPPVTQYREEVDALPQKNLLMGGGACKKKIFFTRRVPVSNCITHHNDASDGFIPVW
jgi:hypothetical protein